MQTGVRENGGNQRPRKTPTSCQLCHSRKVRCDVGISGRPCTNCRLDGQRCAARVPLKRGRKKRAAEASDGAFSSDWTREAEDEPARPSRTAGAAPAPADCQSPTERVLRFADSSPREKLHGPAIFVPVYYYRFLTIADMRHLSPLQVAALETAGCLKVPSGTMLDEFMCQYFRYVHPWFPLLLDEGHFWTMYTGTAPTNSDAQAFPLALFQGMLFAACRFLDITLINACGFEDIKHARTAFHHRAELLLSHGLVSDDIALAQTSLLLSLHPTINDQSLNSLWLSKAVSHAIDAGANTYYLDDDRCSNLGLTKKRIWWCCILRDRMIALGVRRNVQIPPETFNFDEAGLTEHDLAHEFDSSEVYSIETKRALAKVLIIQCELAVAMTSTLTTAYERSLRDFSGVATMAELLEGMVEAERARTELAVWARRYRTELVTSSGINEQDSALHRSVRLMKDMASIHYHSTLVALYNHEASILKRHEADLEDYDDRLATVNSGLRSAVINVTSRIKALSELGLVHCLPISAQVCPATICTSLTRQRPACSALPLILESLDLRLSTVAQRSAHQQHLTHYNKVMKLFAIQHDHAEYVSTVINNLLQVTNAELRYQASQQTSLHLSDNSPLSNWSDIFATNQMTYLRLSKSLDLSLSRGRISQVSDLPSWVLGTPSNLQAPLIALSLHLINPSVMPQHDYDFRPVEEIGEDDEIIVQSDESMLGQICTNEVHQQTAGLDYIMPWAMPEDSRNILGSNPRSQQQQDYEPRWTSLNWP